MPTTTHPNFDFTQPTSFECRWQDSLPTSSNGHLVHLIAFASNTIQTLETLLSPSRRRHPKEWEKKLLHEAYNALNIPKKERKFVEYPAGSGKIRTAQYARTMCERELTKMNYEAARGEGRR